jgi:hypothetical protein
VGLGEASVVLTCDEFKIGRLHQRQVGRLRIKKWSASNRKFLAGLISELTRSSWGLQEGSLQGVIALAQGSLDRGKAR